MFYSIIVDYPTKPTATASGISTLYQTHEDESNLDISDTLICKHDELIISQRIFLERTNTSVLQKYLSKQLILLTYKFK